MMRKSTSTKPNAVDHWRCGRRVVGCTSKTLMDGSCGIAGGSPLAVLTKGKGGFSKEREDQ